MAVNIDIKHRAYNFAKKIVLFIEEQAYKKIHYSLIDQLLRSSTSIGANIVEGYAGSSKRDFIKFYTIALKSANETKFWLCLLRDTIWKKQEDQLNELLNEAIEISKILASIIIRTKENHKNKGV